MNRRHFLSSSSMLCLGAASQKLQASLLAKQPSMLVLGGTGWFGPTIVDAAVAAGYDVTLFNRGITNPQLFPQLRKLRGVRSTDPSKENLSALHNGTWDVVVDIWPSEPSMVSSAAKLLQSKTGHYIFVSSIAAYAISNYAHAGTVETATLREFFGDETDYGRSKAESERRLNDIVREKLTVLRPGAIEDVPPVQCRYGGGLVLRWIARCLDGRRHIGPGDGTDCIQFIDARSISDFLLQAIQKRHLGTYNVVRDYVPLRQYVDECKQVTHSQADFVWIPRWFLEDHALYPACYIGDGKPQYFDGWIADAPIKGLYQMSNGKIQATGWRARSFESVAADMLTDCPVMPKGQFDLPESLSPEKEAAVLDAWERVQRLAIIPSSQLSQRPG